MKRILINKAWGVIFIYLVISFIFFCFVAYNVLVGEIDFQFYADSKTYEEAAKLQNIDSLVHVGGNFFGPLKILAIIGYNNYWGIFIFNVILFIISLYFISREKDINIKGLFILIIFSPITFTSLFSINKEIISLLCICILLYNHNKRNILLVLCLLFLSYLVRWQFTVFYLLYLIFYSKLNFLKARRMLSIMLILIVISIVLYYTQNTLLSSVFNIYERTYGEYTAGAGTIDIIMNIQTQYGYVFAFIPKILHLLVGMISRYKMIFDFSDVYNNFILFFQAPLNIYLLYLNYKCRLFNMKNDYFLISLLYCAVFAITPIYSIRYFYPVSILLAYSYASQVTSYKPSIFWRFLNICSQIRSSFGNKDGTVLSSGLAGDYHDNNK